MHPFVAEPQSGNSLTIHFGRTDYWIEGVLANRAIVGDLRDVEKTPVGLEADLPQRWQVLQSLADTEVARRVEGGFAAKGAPFLVVLLDPGVLVIDMKGRITPVSGDPRLASAKIPPARSKSGSGTPFAIPGLQWMG